MQCRPHERVCKEARNIGNRKFYFYENRERKIVSRLDYSKKKEKNSNSVCASEYTTSYEKREIKK